MQVLKIIVLSVLGLFVVALVGLFIFIKTLDLNKYLPQITQSASDALKRKVTIDQANLNLALKGIILDVKGVAVADPDSDHGPIARIDRVHVGLDILPLITQRVIHVTNIVLDSISYVDQTPALPLNILINNVTIGIHNFSLNQPFTFVVDATTMSNVPNIHAEGTVALDLSKSSAVISDVSVKSDLSQLDIDQIKKVTPMLLQVPFPQKFQGMVVAKIARVDASSAGMTGLSVSIELSNGSVTLKELLNPVTQIQAHAMIDLNDVHVNDFALTVASGTVKGKAALTDYLKSQAYSLNVDIADVNAEEVVDPKTLPFELKGKVTGNFQASGEGFTAAALNKNLKGNGTFNVTDGVIENLNILKMTLGNTLNVIPGLADQMDNLLTSSLKDQLGGDNTVLQKAEAKFSIQDGIATIDEAIATTKAFELNATGKVGVVSLNADIQTALKLSVDASATVAAKVKEFAYLMDDNKQIVITGGVSGVIPHVKYKPSTDVKKVTQNAIVDQGSQQLQKVIEKNPEVGNILNAVFGSKNSDGTAMQTGNSSDDTKNSINNAINKFFK